ncbi:hypothetical protein GQ457_14G023700 [Hibiscus cannabinus]
MFNGVTFSDDRNDERRILRYLKGTLDFGLWYPNQSVSDASLFMFSDVDWGCDHDDRRSVSGYYLFYGNHLITWSFKKQRMMSRFIVEAEYRSLADATSEAMWIKAMIAELNVLLTDIIKLWCNNTSVVSIAANPVLHTKTKQVDLDLHFVRKRIAAHVYKLTMYLLMMMY